MAFVHPTTVFFIIKINTKPINIDINKKPPKWSEHKVVHGYSVTK